MRNAGELRCEEALASRLRARDPLALRDLYRQCGGFVYRLNLRLVGDAATAEDLTQETFLYLWTRAAQFDPARGSLTRWVYLVARSRALDHLRSSQYRIGRRTDSLEGFEAAAPARRGDYALERHVEEAMRALSEPERESLRLAHWCGMSQREIAARLNRPLGTVKTWMRRGHRSLRAALENALVF